MSSAREQISVEALKNVSVLYEGDIYELARLLLKVNDARDKATNATSRYIVTGSRYTVHGVASAYCNLAQVEHGQIIEVFRKHGLPLTATVEPAGRCASPQSPT